MRSPRDDSHDGRSEPCLHPRRRRRRKERKAAAPPSRSVLRATLFVACVFSPSNRDDALRFPGWLSARAFSAPRGPAASSRRRPRGPSSGRGDGLAISTAGVFEIAAVATRRDFEKMTVKQLRSHIQNEGMNVPKGQASNLKLKRQIVDFIWNYQNNGHDLAAAAAAAADDDDDGGKDIFSNAFDRNGHDGVHGESNGKEVVDSPKLAPGESNGIEVLGFSKSAPGESNGEEVVNLPKSATGELNGREVVVSPKSAPGESNGQHPPKWEPGELNGIEVVDSPKLAPGESNGKEVVDSPKSATGELNGMEVVDSPKSTPPAKGRRKTSKLSAGTGMPPLPTSAPGAANRDDDENASSYALTRKDRIVLDVLHAYPPLHQSILDSIADDDEKLSRAKVEGMTESDMEHFDLSALDYVVPSEIGEGDVRHLHHPMMANSTQSDMDVVFIGTASCSPGTTRGVSCTALRLNWRSGGGTRDGGTRDGGSRDRQTKKAPGEGRRKKKVGGERRARTTGGTWLFDCGESTQLSVQRTSSVRPGKIARIFVTHCHGDHSFGLPGLLCLAGTDRTRDDPPVEIYGPEGLRMWLRVAVRYSVSRVVPPYRVHELMDVPMAPEWEEGRRRNGRFYYQVKRDGAGRNGDGGASGGKGRRWGTQGLAGEDPSSWISRAPMINLEASEDFKEVEGGRDIFPRYDHPQASDGAPVWEVFGPSDPDGDEDVSVRAAPMSHGVPCVGYVVRERDQPGKLRPELVLEAIERNREALLAAGIRNPMKVMAEVKELGEGDSYAFPDGTVLRQEDVVEPPRRGRKVVVCGDTADSRALEGLGRNADVLVHEATNTYLPGIDKDTSLRLTTRDAKIHGHSTPYMAGEFAKRINAKKLVMNHFSARYKGDQSVESMTIMTRMEHQAMRASGLPEDSVAAAWDFMVLPVPRNG